MHSNKIYCELSKARRFIIIKLQIIICKDTTLERGHDILLYLQELREMNVDEQETQKYGKD